MDAPTHIALDAPLYMAVTQDISFFKEEDGTVSTHHTTISDGPFTTRERAVEALNKRTDNHRFVEVTGELLPYSYGMYDDNDGISSWQRGITYLNMHTQQQVPGWQLIDVVRLDGGIHARR